MLLHNQHTIRISRETYFKHVHLLHEHLFNCKMHFAKYKRYSHLTSYYTALQRYSERQSVCVVHKHEDGVNGALYKRKKSYLYATY